MNQAPQTNQWQQDLKQGLRTAEDLVSSGLIPAQDLERYKPLLEKYQFFLPRYYAELIDREDPHCPIRKQAVPDLRELEARAFSNPDPLGDLSHKPVERVTHRYRNRLLLHLTPNCSMYCRYCFRKSLLNELSSDLFQGGLEPAIQYIASTSQVEEVILSGGDPLFVSDATLCSLFERIQFIPHVKRIRIHTRVPVTFPNRITKSLCESVKTRLPTIIVVHFNHPKELTGESIQACRALQETGATLLNQSVLLSGVNDSVEVLKKLSEQLFIHKILPYYLHHPDAAMGTEHFAVTKYQGLELYRELRTQLPGYLVPKYVWDDGSSRFKAYVGE